MHAARWYSRPQWPFKTFMSMHHPSDSSDDVQLRIAHAIDLALKPKRWATVWAPHHVAKGAEFCDGGCSILRLVELSGIVTFVFRPQCALVLQC